MHHKLIKIVPAGYILEMSHRNACIREVLKSIEMEVLVWTSPLEKWVEPNIRREAASFVCCVDISQITMLQEPPSFLSLESTQ
jgi:hypothetical protein